VIGFLAVPSGGTTLAGMWTSPQPEVRGLPTRDPLVGILGRAVVYAGILMVLVAAAAWSVNQVQVGSIR
jgi:hypothetical protein